MISDRPRRHYKNAPITEAVIDIQLEPSATGLDVLTALAEKLKSEFPTRLPIHQLQMGFQASPDHSANFSNAQTRLGWRLDNANNSRILQIRTTGFTYSHMAPYSDWGTFSGEALRLWKMYVEAYRPTTIHRRAVRVINRLPIDPSDSRLDSYLSLYPSLPESLSNNAQSMLMQLQLPMAEVDPNAGVILGLYTPQNPVEQKGLMLDIDLFVLKVVQVDDNAFSIFDTLGTVKDDIFEACITDRVREKIA